ncbi:MAG: PAS domain-containing protein [Elusimicrobiota bacterium]|jgi:PAS domain S-box-containing protein
MSLLKHFRRFHSAALFLTRLSLRKQAPAADKAKDSLQVQDTLVNGLARYEVYADGEGTPYDYRFIDVNASFSRLTGLSREQVVGHTLLEVLPNTERAWLEAFARTAKTGEPGRFETFVRSLDRYYEVGAYRSAPGEITATFADVTERNRAAQGLQRSEQRFRLALEGSRVSVWEQDLDLRYTWIHNPGAHYMSADWLGKKDSDLLPESEAEKVVEEKHRVLETGRGTRDTVFLRIGDEDHAYDRRLEPLYDERGALRGLLGVSVDVTDQLRTLRAFQSAETRLRIAVTNRRISVFEMDLDLRYTWYFGPPLEGLPAAIIGRKDEDCFPPETAARMKQLKQKVLDAGERTSGEVEFLIGKKRTCYDCLFEPLRAQDGSVRGLLGVTEDVSQHRNLEQQLRQAQKMEAVGQLAGGIAHDFNNILTSIQGYGEMLRNSLPADDTQRADVQEILDAAERAAALTRQLLAFSRRQVLSPTALDLNKTLSGMVKMLRRFVGEDIELALKFDESVGQAKVDPGQIEQVVMNLVVNAREAMPGGGKLVLSTANAELDEEFVRARPGLAPGHYVMISISDNGPGMEPGTKAHLFEPFFTTKERGSGLGLATVYGIIKQSSGEIDVESELGLGTIFRIYLPRVQEAEQVPAAPKDEAQVPGGRETLLVAEDDAVVRSLTCKILTRAGYMVLAARNGQEAVQIAQEHKEKIDLLVTDVIMPGMNGRELAGRLCALRPGIKTLYMSGYTDDAILKRGILESGIAFLPKPFKREPLLRKVREVLDLR